MSEINVNFDQLPESKEFKSINKAGVHMKFYLDEIEFKEKSEKDGKKIGESVRLLLKSDNAQFTIYKFTPPTQPEDVKFTGGVYKNGKEIRKRTAEEQIQADFAELFYFYEQLAKALGGSKESIDKFRAALKGVDLPNLFKTMFDKFFTIFPQEKIKTKLINFKALWNNNEKQKTSFLGIAKPSGTNMIFSAYVSDTNPVLEVSAFEEKNMVRKFSPLDRAPQNNATEAGSTGDVLSGPPPVITDEKDLF